MMRFNPFTAAAILSMVMALGLALRVFSQNSGFRLEVNQSLATTEGYDQKFIDLVDHLEQVLAFRASFSYPGGKDPMTGRRREMATPISEPAPRRAVTARSAPASKNAAAAKPDSGKVPAAPAAPTDQVKLTAIIADDYGQHTAIVMDGERSLSVDVGDMVGPRKVTRITGKDITMENDSAVYSYDLSGNRNYQKK
ncbi:MAG TPA: hypothetical protein VJ385_22675 [Fibrobacteria bacterium]|nr:hypothetical protein [Fibrobacteria bacterium]